MGNDSGSYITLGFHLSLGAQWGSEILAPKRKPDTGHGQPPNTPSTLPMESLKPMKLDKDNSKDSKIFLKANCQNHGPAGGHPLVWEPRGPLVLDPPPPKHISKTWDRDIPYKPPCSEAH